MSLGQPWQIHQPHLLVSGKQTRGIPGWGIGRQGLALVGALLIVLVWSQPEASSTNHTGSSLESRCHSAMNGSLGYYSERSDMVGCSDSAWSPKAGLFNQNSTIEESLESLEPFWQSSFVSLENWDASFPSEFESQSWGMLKADCVKLRCLGCDIWVQCRERLCEVAPT